MTADGHGGALADFRALYDDIDDGPTDSGLVGPRRGSNVTSARGVSKAVYPAEKFRELASMVLTGRKSGAELEL